MARTSPTADGALLNGTNIYPCTSNNLICVNTAKRWQTTVEHGKRYRLRLINSSVQNYYRFTIDNHRFRIIANDLVPVIPHDTDSLVIAQGQRFDVVFETDQEVGNYWIRAMYQVSDFPMAHPNNTLGILCYEGANERADPVSENYLMDSVSATYANGPGYIDVLTPRVNTEIGPPAVEMEISVNSGPSTFLWLINNVSHKFPHSEGQHVGSWPGVL
jgi:FtsP/CotA-like multicopper oxidase with cupredoxin domain